MKKTLIALFIESFNKNRLNNSDYISNYISNYIEKFLLKPREDFDLFW